MGNIMYNLIKGKSRRSSSKSETESSRDRDRDRVFLEEEEERIRRRSSSKSAMSASQEKASSVPRTQNSFDKNNNSTKHKYKYIPDNFSTLDQVTAALRQSGLESSNLIVGIDFTKSNEWTGKVSFNNRSLHAITERTPNPYEKAISVIGKTLAPFDEDNLIPCFGFGDVTTHDQKVFSFHSDHSPCHGFEEVLSCYKKIVPHLQLSGPTSYGPVVEAAIATVEESGGQFHVLVIIADGQVPSKPFAAHPVYSYTHLPSFGIIEITKTRKIIEEHINSRGSVQRTYIHT